jgi:glycogen synthase
VRICLISPEHSPWGGIGRDRRRQAALLATRHDVTLIYSGGETGQDVPAAAPVSGVREVVAEPSPDQAKMVFACEDHRRSAAVLEAMERVYGSAGPDYVEVSDYRAHGLVPLQARQSGHPMLADTFFSIKLSSTAELICLHDATLEQPGMRLVAELEREQFRLADHVVWRGGDVLDLYRRYYHPAPLPEATRIRSAFDRAAGPPRPPRRDPGEPLRLLFVGRLQRCKGAIDLVEACLRLPRDDWQLTMIGADTDTAPLGRSVRMTIEAMCGADPRVRIEDALSQEEVHGRWAEHDLLVLPSTFEVWANVALEAMRAGLPILATPIGGPSEIVEDGVTGWQTADVGADAIRRALTDLLEDREELERVRASGAIYERLLRLTDPEEILDDYDRMLAACVPGAAQRAPKPTVEEPLVTAVVPYHRASPYVEEAVGSFLAQTHSKLEVVIVDDGSFESNGPLDSLAADPRVTVVTQLNKGEAAARNLGACLARGRYLLMLDADNLVEPEFVARAVATLERDPELAYVTPWLRLILPDGSEQEEPSVYAALGNAVVASDSTNWDGDALAVFPRRLFSELGYRYEPKSGIQGDWELYRQLRGDGRFGAVIPTLLARYRNHPEALTKSHQESLHQRAWDEALNRLQMHPVRWTAEG